MHAHGTTRYHPPILHFLDRAGFIVCLTIGGLLGLGYALTDARPVDAWVFWAAGHASEMYGDGWSLTSLYVYPPPLAQLTGLLPWPVFVAIWMPLIFWSMWFALRWVSGVVMVIGMLVLLFGRTVEGPLVSPLIFAAVGNPQAVVTAAIVAGFARPAVWAFPLVTKIGPGLGLAWFVFRREWWPVVTALAVMGAVVTVSLVASPEAWGRWLAFAIDNWDTPAPVPVVPVPLFIRLPMSLVLIWWGARTNRKWTVLVGAGWGTLALYEWSYLTVWLAAIPLIDWSKFPLTPANRAATHALANTQPSKPE